MIRGYFFLFIFFCACSLSFVEAQNTDSIKTQQIKEVEVLSTTKPSISLSTIPLQQTTKSDIDRIGIQSVSDAIRRFTGVVVKDYGGIGGFKGIAIRGNGAEHTAILYDGIAITNTQSGQIDIGQFSLDNIDMLSLTIGQSDNIFKTARATASVGVLDIETRTPIFTDKKDLLQLQIKTGSWGLFNPYVYYAHKLSDKFSVSLDGNWQRADGKYSYEVENGSFTSKHHRKNSDVDIKRTELNLFGKLDSKQSIRFKAYYFDSERGLPGAYILQGTSILEDKAKERLWDKNLFTQAQYVNQLTDKFDFQLSGKYTHSYTKYRIEENIYVNGFQEDRYYLNEYYLNGIVRYKQSDYMSFSFAEDFSYNTLRANYNGFASPDRYSSLSAFSGKYENSRITFVGNLLATYISDNVKIGTAAKDKKRLSPALSLSYKPFDLANLRLRASYKNTFRVPSFNDLYYARMGNSELKPERAQQYNIGAIWTNSFSEKFNFFNISGDFFYNTVKDKIVAYPSTFQPKMVNLGKVRITGFSLATSGEISLNEKIQMQISGNYTYQKAIDVTSSEQSNYKDQIPHTPEHSGSGSFSLENPWVNLSYSLVVASKSYSTLANNHWSEVDGYTDQSISLNKTLKIKSYMVRLQADVTNLANKTYYIIKYYPMPGRAYRLSMTMKF